MGCIPIGSVEIDATAFCVPRSGRWRSGKRSSRAAQKNDRTDVPTASAPWNVRSCRQRSDDRLI